MPQSEIHPTSGFRAVRRESRRQRPLNSATTHPCDIIDTAIDWEEIRERSSNFSKNLSVFKLHRSKSHLQDYFTRLMMNSESCSTSSSSSGDDFVPISFCFARQ